jgi:nicotinamide-nucleotide amidase
MNSSGGRPAAALAERLGDAGHTVAVAETVTGGLVGARLSAVAGASDYFDRAYVAYDYDALREMVGVSRETLDEHGAVSRPVARELARRARDLADATWGASTVGVAGPGGGTAEKPVGTAFVGVARAAPWGSGESATRIERLDVEGDRGAVRDAVADAALRAVARRIETLDGGGEDGEA